jgi:hypothetical protein
VKHSNLTGQILSLIVLGNFSCQFTHDFVQLSLVSTAKMILQQGCKLWRGFVCNTGYFFAISSSFEVLNADSIITLLFDCCTV